MGVPEINKNWFAYSLGARAILLFTENKQKPLCGSCNQQRILILLYLKCSERVVLYVEVLLKNSAHSKL